MPATLPTQERRRFPRQAWSPRVAINLLQPPRSIPVNSLNVSKGGLCLRLREELEVRSLVQLQLTLSRLGAVRDGRPVTCTGRVTWIIQRLDLQRAPPLFDVGIEFVDPPPLLRQVMARRGIERPVARGPELCVKTLDTAVIRGRYFLPRLERPSHPGSRWHLVVAVEGVPCFSERFASERAALAAWTRFKRQQAKR